jgi:CheY-like chemotaxis protein
MADTVAFGFHVKHPYQNAPNPHVMKASCLHPCRILVADDDSAIRRLSTRALTHFGYSADSAEDGAEAWRSLETRRYDLLITDNSMPMISGLELLRRLHDARVAIPVIMASGTIPAKELERSPWLAPAAILQKPYTLYILLKAVADVLQTAGLSGRQDSCARRRAS